MNFWEKFSSFKKANNAWDTKSQELEKKRPLKKVSFHPKNKPARSTSIYLRIKSFFYLIKQDKKLRLFKFFLKKAPFYTFNLFKSYFSKKPYFEDNDLYFYNCKTIKEFKQALLDEDSLLVLGFSFCHKPIECPVKRFSEECIHDPNDEICAQCFIGKCSNALKTSDIHLVIPDVKYIGEKLFEITQKNPHKKVIFIITSCSLSIEMFSDFANMLKVKGLAIKLAGRVCMNYQSFLFAEKGIKPGLTIVEDKNQKLLMDLLQNRWEALK